MAGGVFLVVAVLALGAVGVRYALSAVGDEFGAGETGVIEVVIGREVVGSGAGEAGVYRGAAGAVSYIKRAAVVNGVAALGAQSGGQLVETVLALGTVSAAGASFAVANVGAAETACLTGGEVEAHCALRAGATAGTDETVGHVGVAGEALGVVGEVAGETGEAGAHVALKAEGLAGEALHTGRVVEVLVPTFLTGEG